MSANYKKGRHFVISSNEVVEMIFADDADEEVDNLDNEDIEVLTAAYDLGKDTVVISTDNIATETSEETANSFSMPDSDEFKLTWVNKKSSDPKMPVITKSLEYSKLHIDDVESTEPYHVFTFVRNFEELVDFIVLETNRYANSKGEVFVTTSEEIKAFLGIVLLMGYHKLPTLRS